MKNMQDKAILLAKKFHKGQFRKTGEPYVEHCLRVMKTISEYTKDEDVLTSAVLHDIFEDTTFSLADISTQFSPKVSFIVSALSKNKKLEKFDSEYRILLYLNRFAKGCLNEKWILFIKIADQIDNSQSFHIFRKEKQERKRNEIIQHFIPIYQKISHNFTKKEEDIYNSLIKKLDNNIKFIK